MSANVEAITPHTGSAGGKATMKKLLLALGIGLTSTALAAAGPAVAGDMNTPVWIGAPFEGAWPGDARNIGSMPDRHRPVFTVPGHNWLSDWAIDLYAPEGTPVRVYASPQDPNLEPNIHAQVIEIRDTCRPDSGNFAGWTVFVGIFHDDARVGTVAYAHLNPDLNHDGVTDGTDLAFRGEPIEGGRWGGYLGTVGAGYDRSGCWDVRVEAGHHTHVELSNENSSVMACFRPGLSGNEVLGEHEYIGYLGGAWATQRSQPCPNEL